MEIKYTGTKQNILKILQNLPGNEKAVRVIENSITIPTIKGAKQVFKGDFICIDGESVTVKERK